MREVARKIGAATADFHALDKVWKHSCISRARKLELYVSLIESKLRYALSSAWLLKADLRRLDGFQARCLRKILGVCRKQGGIFIDRFFGLQVTVAVLLELIRT